MRFLRYIWFVILLAGLTVNAAGQYVSIVCAGDTGQIYKVSGSEGSSFNWTVNGGLIAQNYGDSIKVNWGNAPGEFTIRVQEFSRHGCPSVPVTGRVLVSAPVLSLGDTIDICEGESVTIAPEGNFTSFRWHDGSTAPVYTARNQGLISLEVTDQHGCVRSDNVFLTVHPLPRVNLGRDTALCGNETIVLDAGGDGVQYTWSTGDVSRDISAYQGRQTIWVKVKDMYNCENSDTININACSSIDYFKDMPTAFTPNDDGVNDEWRIPQLQAFPQAVVEIFDRWGNMIFRSEPGYSRPWDGTYQGRDMPVDSYYFIIRLNSGDMAPLTGTVTLIR